MVIENLSDLLKMPGLDLSLLKNLPPELVSKIEDLLFIFKAIGIILLIYIIFLIIKSILSIIEKRRIKKIYWKVNEISDKLDLLIRHKTGKKDSNELKTDKKEDKKKKK